MKRGTPSFGAIRGKPGKNRLKKSTSALVQFRKPRHVVILACVRFYDDFKLVRLDLAGVFVQGYPRDPIQPKGGDL
jgi:hypothetical protein